MSTAGATRGKLNAEQLQQYEDEGYVILEDLFTPEEIDPIRELVDGFDRESEAALAAAQKDAGINKAGVIMFTSFLNFKHPDLQKFIADQRFVDLGVSILGPNVKLYWDQSVYKRPEADRDFPWHQDNGYAPVEPMKYLTCWLALADSTLENGCIWVQPGTHKRGLVPHVKTDIGQLCYYGDIEGTPVPLKKGSMVAFSSLLYHRSTPNRTKDQMRKGYVVQYCVDGAINPKTGETYRNGPTIARDGKPVYSGFLTKEQC